MYFYARKKDGLIKSAMLYDRPIPNSCLLSVEVPDGFTWPEITPGNRHTYEASKALTKAQKAERILVLDLASGSLATELSDAEILAAAQAERKEQLRQEIAARLFDDDYDTLKADYVIKCDEITSASTVDQVKQV